jgi:anti-sigma regulatory factor (Ser/Thr protein kinase)
MPRLNDRLLLTVRYLSDVSRALAAPGDFETAVQRILSLSVPTMFDGISVRAYFTADGREFASSSGRTEGDSSLFAPISINEVASGHIYVWTARKVDDVDQGIVSDIAIRLGFALDTGHAIAREQHVSETFQRALLPQELPQTLHVAFSAAYRPATDEAIVGGDWYDVFHLPDGKTAFALGDVAGHGLQAAVIMSEVRQTFRAAAATQTSPAHILERANEIVNLRSDSLIVTALFGILDSQTATVTYAVAGHPAPIISTATGKAHILPSSGCPLGVMDSLETCDWTMTLAPGALLALYSDGLIEYSRDVIAGEASLVDAVCAQAQCIDDNPAEAILNRVFATQSNTDDAAALILQALSPVPEHFAFEFSAVPLGVPLLRQAFENYVQSIGVREELQYDLLLAVSEAAANSVEHAYVNIARLGTVRVRAHLAESALIIEIADQGRWRAPERCDERGRGLKIMRALMDRVEIKTVQTETVVRLTLHHFAS